MVIDAEILILLFFYFQPNGTVAEPVSGELASPHQDGPAAKPPVTCWILIL